MRWCRLFIYRLPFVPENLPRQTNSGLACAGLTYELSGRDLSANGLPASLQSAPSTIPKGAYIHF